jgi:hypothetical protein
MMSDLVQRLREKRWRFMIDGKELTAGRGSPWQYFNRDGEEAADRIEELERQLTEATGNPPSQRPEPRCDSATR